MSTLSRYFSRQILLMLSAMTFVLLVTFTSTRFIQYLSDAALGKISADVVFPIMAYRMPGFLAMILPVALFLSILLVYGRLYIDNEMAALRATGVSNWRLIGYTAWSTLTVTAVVALFSLYLNPLGRQQTESILNDQAQRTEFDFVVPGKFHSTGNHQRVFYTESKSDNNDVLGNVFIAEKNDQGQLSVLVGNRGNLIYTPENRQRYLVLTNGHRYNGVPGQRDYNNLSFERYGILVEPPEISDKDTLDEAIPTLTLLKNNSPKASANLQWRLSLPLLVPVVALLAIPLSRVDPRQGRFARIFPALMIYISYLGLLIYGRKAIEQQAYPAVIGLWPVHLLFLGLAVLLFVWPQLRLKRGSLSTNTGSLPSPQAT
ncbi:LPS export ABC transporter permease LptF [Hahella sp. CCB-MM4]|nr:LPS export ABC transporter permease LptF [Hahella sp. CCB-MM4]